MKRIAHIIWVGFVCLVPFLVSSCEKTLDIDEPADRELVLNAVPAAGRQPFVHFAYTRFFLDDNNDQPVPGAQLTLYVNDTVRPLVGMVNSLYYFADTLRPDDRLRIDIQADGRSVHAETYVPLYPAVSSFTPFFFASETFNFVATNFYLDDHAGRDEYYNITVTVRDSGARFNEWLGRLDTVDTVHTAMFTVPNSPDITDGDVAVYSPLGGRLMFLDRRIDGQHYQVPLWIILLKDTTEVAPFKHYYTVDVESITPARWNYILSASSQNSMTSFFAEQGRVFSNVNGALGIFAGSAKRRYQFDLATVPGFPASAPPPEVEQAARQMFGHVPDTEQ